MLNYIIRRLLLVIPTLLGITFVVFMTMVLSPGGVGASLLSQEQNMRPAEREELRKYYNKHYGLDKPPLVQYGRWLNRVSPMGFHIYDDDVPLEVRDAHGQMQKVYAKDPKTGKDTLRLLHGAGDIRWGWPILKAPDLGESFVLHQSVGALFAERLPVTLLLNGLALPIIYSIAIITGINSARYRGKTYDVSVGTLFIVLWSVPVMLTGVLGIGYLANRDVVALFPTSGLHDMLAPSMPFMPHWGAQGFERGWLLDALWHLGLPVICLTYGSFAFLSKLMRAAVLENLSSDFVRTARAKGVSGQRVLYVHVFRNSLLPLITVASGILPGLLGGSLIVERIFSLRGMGTLMIDAVNIRDYELVLAETLVIGLLDLLCLLAADICYTIADPRVSYE